MKVLFIYPDVSTAVGYSSGIGALAAVLKRAGHTLKLLHISSELGYPLDLARIIQDVQEFNPGLICMSVTTNQWYFARQIGREIKKHHNIPIILGGAHPTADPEGVMAQEWMDFICRGEGDKTLPEVVRRLEEGVPLTGVPNLMFKDQGRVFKEPLGPWIDDLETLPFEDHAIFNYGKIIDTRSGWAEIIITRGCPYPCAYCFNQPLFKEYQTEIRASCGLTPQKKGYVRRRSVDSTLQILKELQTAYPNIRGFTFVDDIFAKEGNWFTTFTRRYKQEIGLPYACTSHPLLFNQNVARLLKDSGCKVVKMGVEAGNPDIRRRVLRRNISNHQLIEVFQIAKDFGLKPQSFNMIGLPGETFENMLETIQLNAAIKPYIVWLSTFIPYPGTELYRECRKHHMIDEAKWDQVHSYRGDSILKEEFLPFLPFRKLRLMFLWLLNARLNGQTKDIYQPAIDQLSALPDEQWRNGSVEKLYAEKADEIDRILRERDISHYVKKKYINIFWGKEYDYDLT